MVYFNRVGVLRQQAEMLGRAMGMTKEQDAYNVITTAGNFTRNSTTGAYQPTTGKRRSNDHPQDCRVHQIESYDNFHRLEK